MCTIYDNSNALMGLCSDDNICGLIKGHSCESQVHYRKEFARGIHTESQWEAMLYAGTHSPVIWIGKSCCVWIKNVEPKRASKIIYIASYALKKGVTHVFL